MLTTVPVYQPTHHRHPSNFTCHPLPLSKRTDPPRQPSSPSTPMTHYPPRPKTKPNPLPPLSSRKGKGRKRADEVINTGLTFDEASATTLPRSFKPSDMVLPPRHPMPQRPRSASDAGDETNPPLFNVLSPEVVPAPKDEVIVPIPSPSGSPAATGLIPAISVTEPSGEVSRDGLTQEDPTPPLVSGPSTVDLTTKLSSAQTPALPASSKNPGDALTFSTDPNGDLASKPPQPDTGKPPGQPGSGEASDSVPGSSKSDLRHHGHTRKVPSPPTNESTPNASRLESNRALHGIILGHGIQSVDTSAPATSGTSPNQLPNDVSPAHIPSAGLLSPLQSTRLPPNSSLSQQHDVATAGAPGTGHAQISDKDIDNGQPLASDEDNEGGASASSAPGSQAPPAIAAEVQASDESHIHPLARPSGQLLRYPARGQAYVRALADQQRE